MFANKANPRKSPMKKQHDFGFVTACHPADKFMVQATLASIRHYCPDVPICLLADGGVDVEDLEKMYDLIVKRPEDLPDKSVAKMVSGNYRIKLLAMWYGPFEHYVWIDSDAIVWGNFTDRVRRDLDFQIFWSQKAIDSDAQQPPDWLGHFYFDLPSLLERDPSFEWRTQDYFSAGVYACRKNAIRYEEWMRCESWDAEKQGGVFRFGDQGILNYLVLAGAQKGSMRVQAADLQYLPHFHGREEIDRDTAGCGLRWPENISRPRAVHLCGQKPFLHNRKAYSRAFTIARLEHHRRSCSKSLAWLKVLGEEWRVIKKKIQRRLFRFAKSRAL